MTWRIVRYDITRALRRPTFWVLYALFAGLGFLAVQALGGVFDSFRLIVDLGGDTLRINSPYLASMIIQTVTGLGLPLVAAFFGNAIHREIRDGSGALLWTTPLSKWAYWIGRSAAAFGALMLLLSSVGLGAWLGTRMPWIDPELIGPDRLSFYVYPYLTTVARRTLVGAALVLLAVSVGRSMVAGYLAIVAYVGIGNAARHLTQDLEHRGLAALLDPTGTVAANLVTRTWSTAEKNERLLPLDGWVGANLALWAAVALTIWFLSGYFFRPERQARPPRQSQWQRGVARVLASARRAFAPVERLTGHLPLWLRLGASAYRVVVFHPIFLATILFGLVAVALAAPSVSMLFGTPTWPVTYAVLGVFTSVFEPFALGIVIFFTGHLVWRDRELRLAPLVDPTPHKSWLQAFSRLLAMGAVVVTLQAIVFAGSVAYQTWLGHHRHEWPTYGLDLFGLQLIDLLLLVVLGLFLQVLLRQRHLAYLATIAMLLGVRFAPTVGLDHVLYRYGGDPGYILSELNGVGDFLVGWLTVKAYWIAFATLLLLASIVLWPRGEDHDRAPRRRRMRRRLGPAVLGPAAIAATTFLGLGIWIFYNTNVLQAYQTPKATEALQVRTETELRAWRDEPQPRVTVARFAVDLYPLTRRADVRGRLTLVNRHAKTVDTLLLRVPKSLTLETIAVSGTENRASDTPVTLETRAGGYRTLTLLRPLAPGETMELTYEGVVQRRGFPNQDRGAGVLSNGTFLATALTIGIGYDPAGELTDPRRRRRFELPERAPLPSRDDLRGRYNSLTVDADWVDFAVDVSTAADQIALAPGDLVSSRIEGDRRHFSFRSQVPIQHLWGVVSGRYAVKQETWQGIALEIYHHPDHTDNLDSMMRGLKRSLAYLTETFGPYPHQTLRIVEFPRYATFAMSLPGMIPYSEGIGFIARKRSPDDIDYPFYVTAHEVAHQWFPHHVSPAQVEGIGFLSETFSQYVALRVMEAQFGATTIGKYLRYELDRYLLGRSVSRFDERPLARVHQQQHIYYNKGSLAMIAAADLIGRDAMDAALRTYFERFAFAEPPYPTSEDFLAILRAHAPAAQHPLLGDLFERITFFELSVDDAQCTPLDGGRYRVTLTVDAAKSYADGTGNKTVTPLDHPIEIGILGEKKVLRRTRPTLLELDRPMLESGQHELTYEVDRLPLRAGIDPFFKMVDSTPENNLVDLDCS